MTPLTDVNDFSALAGLRREATHAPNQAAAKVARQFEGLLLQQMLKAMRDSVEAGGLSDDEGAKTALGLFDNQLAQNLAQAGGIGLAAAIERQILSAGAPAAATRQPPEPT